MYVVLHDAELSRCSAAHHTCWCLQACHGASVQCNTQSITQQHLCRGLWKPCYHCSPESAWLHCHSEPSLHCSPGSPGDAPDQAMLADFLSDDLASVEERPALFCGGLQARASVGSQASPWAADADAQAMLPLERMLDMLGQQQQPGAHHAARLPALGQRPNQHAARACCRACWMCCST